MSGGVADGDRPDALRLAGLAALVFALWALQHPYPGIFHDAQLYTIQALSRVFPAELASDVFLRHGSQDRFTAFGPLHAAAIRAIGAGPAAALLTFLAHCAFAGALLLLASRLLPPRLTWVGVGLVCVVPLTYGASKVFFVMEDFLTPRLFAEACVIAGLAACLERRYWLALAAALVAALLHPIMAMGGVATALFLDAWSRRQQALAIAAGAAAALAVFAWLAVSGAQLRFDDEWWSLVHGGLPYLFPLEWRRVDWARVLVLASTLYAGMRWLEPGAARSLCRAALIAMFAGLVLSIVGSDLLRLVLMTQVQPWRVLWLAATLALLLSPLIALQLWRGGMLPRMAIVTLLAAFLLADERIALPCALLAAALVAVCDRVRAELPVLRVVLMGLFALLALAAVVNLASSSIVARARFDQHAVPGWLLTLRSAAGTGLLPALTLVGIGAVLASARQWAAIAAAAVSVAAATIIGIAALPQWTASPFTAATHAAFAPWRAHLPPRAEVLWFEFPTATWILLERPNYASNPQTASVVFSRQAGLLMRDRLQALHPFLDHVEVVAWRPPVDESDRHPPRLTSVCQGTDARFVVTRDELEVAPIAVAADTLPPELRDWKLHACPEAETRP